MRLSLVSVTLGSLLLTLSRYLVKRSSSSGCLNLEELSNPSLESPEEPSSMSGTTCAGSLIVFDKYLMIRKKLLRTTHLEKKKGSINISESWGNLFVEH